MRELFCKDCDHCQHNGVGTTKQSWVCHHEAAIVNTHMVTGHTYNECIRMRKNEAACGKAAKYFQMSIPR